MEMWGWNNRCCVWCWVWYVVLCFWGCWVYICVCVWGNCCGCFIGIGMWVLWLGIGCLMVYFVCIVLVVWCCCWYVWVCLLVIWDWYWIDWWCVESGWVCWLFCCCCCWYSLYWYIMFLLFVCVWVDVLRKNWSLYWCWVFGLCLMCLGIGELCLFLMCSISDCLFLYWVCWFFLGLWCFFVMVVVLWYWICYWCWFYFVVIVVCIGWCLGLCCYLVFVFNWKGWWLFYGKLLLCGKLVWDWCVW